MAENGDEPDNLSGGSSEEVTTTGQEAVPESFEASLDQLEKVVKELEAGDLSLERSIQLFERGVGLSDACRKQLEDAETRVEMLLRKDGKMTAELFRPDKSEKT